MGFDGKWNLEISSPMGAQNATAEFKVDGGVLTGSSTNPMLGASQVENGKVDGDRATWTSSITSPMPMKLEFDVTCSGDTLTGSVKTGSFGTFPIKGARA